MDLEKGGGKNENYDNAEALENYDFKHSSRFGRIGRCCACLLREPLHKEFPSLLS